MSRTTERGLGTAWQALTREARRIYPPTCHLCGRGIDLDLPVNDRMSWTLDHLEAREHHGTRVPTIDRVRPAHRACNSSRGSRPRARLRWEL